VARRDERAYPQWSVSEKERSQRAVSAQTLRAAGLLPVACVGSAITARGGDALACVGSAITARGGDALASPPWPPPKSLAAGPLSISKQALDPQPQLVAIRLYGGPPDELILPSPGMKDQQRRH